MMTEKFSLPLNNNEIDFNQYEKVELIAKGYENSKLKLPIYEKLVFIPVTKSKVEIKDYYENGKLRESYTDGYGTAWHIIGRTIYDFDVGNLIGSIAVYAYPKKQLKGYKTAVWGKKYHRNDTVESFENAVRRMF